MTRPRITGSQIALDARIAWIQPGEREVDRRQREVRQVGLGQVDRQRDVREQADGEADPDHRRERLGDALGDVARRVQAGALALEPLPAGRRAAGLGRQADRPVGADQLARA